MHPYINKPFGERKGSAGGQSAAVEGIDERAGGDVEDTDTAAVGVAADRVVCLESDGEALDDLMEPESAVGGVDSALLGRVVFVEVGLDRDDVVFVVDADGLHPRVVGPGDVYFTVAESDGVHDGRDEDVARSRHPPTVTVGKIFEPLEAFDTDEVIGHDGQRLVVAGDWPREVAEFPWDKECHGPVDFLNEPAEVADARVCIAEEQRVGENVEPGSDVEENGCQASEIDGHCVDRFENVERLVNGCVERRPVPENDEWLGGVNVVDGDRARVDGTFDEALGGLGGQRDEFRGFHDRRRGL